MRIFHQPANTNALSYVTEATNLVWGPRTRCLLDGSPDVLQSFKPAIGRGLKANLTPNSFLRVQTRLVRRQVVHMQSSMSAEELFHGRPLMPTRAVHIEPDRITSQSPVEVFERLQEGFPVSSHHRNHATPPQQR